MTGRVVTGRLVRKPIEIAATQVQPGVFRCPQCGKEFAEERQLHGHIGGKHPQKALLQKTDMGKTDMGKTDTPTISCPHCHQRYQSMNGLRKHLRQAHGKVAKVGAKVGKLARVITKESTDGLWIKSSPILFALLEEPDIPAEVRLKYALRALKGE